MCIRDRLYIPVFPDLVGNKYVASFGLFHFPTLGSVMPTTLHYLVSFRYLVPLLAITGLVLALRRGENREPGRLSLLLCLALLVFVPFVLSFVRGDRPMLRVFVNLAPFLALLLAGLVVLLARHINWLRPRPWLTFVLLFVYCYATFGFGIHHVGQKLHAGIIEGRARQDIFYNYYQAWYEPGRLAQRFAGSQYDRVTPVVMFDVDYAAMPVYLEQYGIEWVDAGALETAFERLDRFYVFTKFPDRFAAMLDRGHPDFGHRRLNNPIRFHNVFLVFRKPG